MNERYILNQSINGLEYTDITQSDIIKSIISDFINITL